MIKKRYESYRDLYEDSLKNNFHIYNGIYENYNTFESICYSEEKYICGLCYNKTGIKSQILLVDDDKKVFVGYEHIILGIELETKNTIVYQKTTAPFYEFLQSEEYIVAISELDIYIFDKNCNLKWTSGFRDIIEDYSILEKNKLFIASANGDKVTFDLYNGTPI